MQTRLVTSAFASEFKSIATAGFITAGLLRWPSAEYFGPAPVISLIGKIWDASVIIQTGTVSGVANELGLVRFTLRWKPNDLWFSGAHWPSGRIRKFNSLQSPCDWFKQTSVDIARHDTS
jgi:hypothetical protein